MSVVHEFPAVALAEVVHVTVKDCVVCQEFVCGGDGERSSGRSNEQTTGFLGA